MPAGWYADPDGRVPSRWWDGVWWTAWESDGDRQWVGSHPGPARRLNADDLPTLAFVRTVFLLEARRRGVLGGHQVDELAGLTDQLAVEVAGPHSAPVAVSTPPAHPAPAPAATPSPAPGTSAP